MRLFPSYMPTPNFKVKQLTRNKCVKCINAAEQATIYFFTATSFWNMQGQAKHTLGRPQPPENLKPDFARLSCLLCPHLLFNM